MADESSRLLENSEDYRTCSIAKNSARHSPGNEYCPATSDTISDGDDKGREPEQEGGSIGTKTDIATREKMIAKNADGYTKSNEYGAGHADTISDGDDKGREPEQEGGSIGTKTDIATRNCMMAKNADGYSPTNQYLPASPNTMADGDEKGREPESAGMEAGTSIDFANRECMLAKNSGLYTKSKEYGFGNSTV